MNSQKPAVVYAWGQDLEASRDVNERQRDAFGMVLGWLECPAVMLVVGKHNPFVDADTGVPAGD